jgi:cytochrome bd-type quinol oxidase subunit 2
MSLGFDIGQGAGLAGATGVRPFLPPLLTGALASGDVGVDFDGTSFSWVESPGFLVAVLAVAVIAYVIDRQAGGRTSTNGSGRPERSPAQAALAVVAMALGAVLFAASLSEGHHTEWPGVLAGMLCAFAGFMAVAMLFARARSRLDGGAAALLNVYADVTSLALAGLSILFPPLGFVVLVGFVVMLVRAGRGGTQKYEGLRILR